MDFEYIEELVTKSKNDDKKAKEKLAEEFSPLIFNISRKTFIDGYEIHDLQHECYKSLFKCVSLYDLEKHRFVAYATNSIKNNMNDLIKRIRSRNVTEGSDALALCDDFDKELPSQDANLEDLLCDECDLQELRLALKNLTQEEKELIDFIFYKNNTVRTYAYFKNMCYSTATRKKNVTLKKIFNFINGNQTIQCS